MSGVLSSLSPSLASGRGERPQHSFRLLQEGKNMARWLCISPLARWRARGIGGGLLCLWFISLSTQAFELNDLQQQMQQVAVVRGDFVQEKHIRGLSQPLISRGHFCLSSAQGLLWNLSAPLKRTLRITAEGVAHQSKGQWQMEAAHKSRQTHLFLAVLRGDTSALQKQFALALNGNSADWQLTLTPKSTVLRQIFTSIQISGGALVTRIELDETSGERTLIKLLDAVVGSALTPEEAKVFEG